MELTILGLTIDDFKIVQSTIDHRPSTIR